MAFSAAAYSRPPEKKNSGVLVQERAHRGEKVEKFTTECTTEYPLGIGANHHGIYCAMEFSLCHLRDMQTGGTPGWQCRGILFKWGEES